MTCLSCAEEPLIRSAGAYGKTNAIGAVGAVTDVGGAVVVSPDAGVDVAALEVNPEPTSRLGRFRRRFIITDADVQKS